MKLHENRFPCVQFKMRSIRVHQTTIVLALACIWRLHYIKLNKISDARDFLWMKNKLMRYLKRKSLCIIWKWEKLDLDRSINIGVNHNYLNLVVVKKIFYDHLELYSSVISNLQKSRNKKEISKEGMCRFIWSN